MARWCGKCLNIHAKTCASIILFLHIISNFTLCVSYNNFRSNERVAWGYVCLLPLPIHFLWIYAIQKNKPNFLLPEIFCALLICCASILAMGYSYFNSTATFLEFLISVSVFILCSPLSPLGMIILIVGIFCPSILESDPLDYLGALLLGVCFPIVLSALSLLVLPPLRNQIKEENLRKEGSVAFHIVESGESTAAGQPTIVRSSSKTLNATHVMDEC